MAAILDYPVLVWLYSISTSPIGMLDPKNMGVAVGISLLSCLQAQAEIACGVCLPPPQLSKMCVKRLSYAG